MAITQQLTTINMTMKKNGNFQPQTQKNTGQKQELVEITPAQYIDQKESFAIIATSLPPSGPNQRPETILITSAKELIILNEASLAQHGYYSSRYPKPGSRWSKESIDEFLEGHATGTLAKAHERNLQQFKKYIDLPGLEYYEVLSVWSIGTYMHRLFSAYPYLHLNGNAESGKSQTLSILASVSFNGRLITEGTAAALVRFTHDNQSTLCLDEVEKLHHAKDDASQTIRSILNSGYKPGSMVPKMEVGRHEKDWNLKEYDPYSPKVLAGIRGLDPTLASRCISILLVRSENEDIVNAILDYRDPSWGNIRDEIYQGVMSGEWRDIYEVYFTLQNDQIKGRDWEMWRPILAISKYLNTSFPGLYDRMSNFSITLVSEKKQLANEYNFAAKLLLALHKYFITIAKKQTVFIPLKELLEFLPIFDEEIFKDPKTGSIHTWINGKWLSNELRKTGLVTGVARQQRVEGKNTKGFTIDYTYLKKRMLTHGLKPDESIQF